MSFSKKVLTVLSFVLMLQVAQIYGMERGPKGNRTKNNIPYTTREIEKKGLFYYYRYKNYNNIVNNNVAEKMTPSELLESGKASVFSTDYVVHTADEYLYATGNALIGTSGLLFSAVGHQNGWFDLKKGFLGILSSMAVYSGLVWAYQQLTPKKSYIDE